MRLTADTSHDSRDDKFRQIKMKRELSLPPIISITGTDCALIGHHLQKDVRSWLSRQIRPRTTTLLMESNTMEPPNGSSRAAHSRNGSQQDHCYGFMKACVSLAFLSITFLMTTDLRIREYKIWYFRSSSSPGVIKKLMDRNAKETHAFHDP